ncbi:MAG: LysM peptidoglycan-binding domain-containing protein [Bacteroidales bacterium]|nr:LysM peptidoglycan-binding domain-containing protein [Bacteroidales bacterium]MBN2763774.1 LysM peptidoglycan-binding domain-containing protein [Bacteroidales bacterium]
MKVKNLFFIILFIAPGLSILASPGQKDTTSYGFDDSIMVELNFDANLDSLLNLYLINQSLSGDPDFWTTETDSTVPDFPDSVFISRLSAIPSVVELSYNSLVRRYIEVYANKRRNQVEVMLGLSQYYFPLFDDILDYYGLPVELKYLSVIESALNPRAYSRARAVGIWQFMYGTGKLYGLTINSLVDERRDPVKSTHAAARFMKDLYAIYNDWTLVIAAYNCGPGNVNKAIRRSHGKRNYWDIYYYLPRETRGYVPAYIAATYVMHYYKEHNLKPRQVELPLTNDTIMVTQDLHLGQVAEVLNMPLKLLRDMNPQYRTDIIPAREKPMPLRLPVDQVFRFIEKENVVYTHRDSFYFNPEKVITSPTTHSSRYAEEIIPPDNYAKLYYTVKPGDNLGYISEWYHVRLSDLRYWNNLRNNTIRAGQRLTVYVPKNKAGKYGNINKMTFAEKQNSIGKKTDNSALAQQSNNGQQPGQQIAYNDNYVYYTVKQGDTLWDIAKNYPGVSDVDIMKLNNLSYSDKIKPGQKLKIKPK